MPILSRWDELTDTDWESLVHAWLEAESNVSDGAQHPDEDSVGVYVTFMNFTARPELVWGFIERAVALVDSDDGMGRIAAGPLEHLLGWHGEVFIARVEERAMRDPKFARVLTGVWRYLMSESIWARVRALQGRVSDPLPACIPFETSDGDG